MTGTLFISDLHLDPQRAEITRLFLDFLGTRGRDAAAVYILGDLFEAWIGDDDDSPLNATITSRLRTCVDSGTSLFFMPGNRDFLTGSRFAEQTGCIQLADPTQIDLYGQPTLLMHGDTLCTDDSGYMEFRRRVRDCGWQRAFLKKPLEERRRISMAARDSSRIQTREKPEYIMDVNQEAVIQIMMKHRVQRLIHGHTHRPAIHDLMVAGKPAQRMVLGDWYTQGSVLECTVEGCQLQTL